MLPSFELLVVQHLEREGPGLLAEVAEAAGGDAQIPSAALERWLSEDGPFVASALGPGDAERLRGDAGRWLAAVRPL
jgi:hypothetical protein